MRRIAKIAAGLFCIAVGIILIPVPILPGWPLILFGSILVSPFHGEKIAAWVKNRKKN